MTPAGLAAELERLGHIDDEQEVMDLVVATADDWMLAGFRQNFVTFLTNARPMEMKAGVLIATISSVQPWRRILRRDKSPDIIVYTTFFDAAYRRLIDLGHDAQKLIGGWA